MKTLVVRCGVVALVLCAVAVAAFGDVPRILTVQAKLTDSLGQPVPDGVQSVTFRLYDVETEGEVRWQEVQNVQTNGGVFNVNLGAVTPITLPFDKQYWLGIQPPSSAELVPRTRLTTAPYAIRAEIADTVKDGAITAEKIAAGAVTGGKIASGAITADKLATGVLGEIGYAQITSDSASFSATITDIAGLSVTVDVPASGRKVKITVYAVVKTVGPAASVAVYIKEGATALQYGVRYCGATLQETMMTQVVLPATAGSHTYKVAAWASASTFINADAYHPAFILVEVI